MVWQDLVISISNLFFTYSLAHQVIHGFKKKKGLLTLTASGLTFVGLYAMSIVFFTLALIYSAIIASVNATLWLILFSQTIVYGQA